MNSFGQNDLNFEYNCKESRNSLCKVYLQFPSGKVNQIYNDRLAEFNLSKQKYFFEKGEYRLIVNFNKGNKQNDTVNYIFELTGEELSININVSFYPEGYFLYNPKATKKETKRTEGFVSIVKYYKSIDYLDIGLIKLTEPSEYCKGPYFCVKNNSRDTIFGEYLPSYLWGSLSILSNDSIWINKGTEIDANFEGSTPLYPDSATIATVGSFGYSNNLSINKYMYTLIYSTENWDKHGSRKYKENDSYVWWVGVKVLYRLNFEFEIKN
jgi:hypothetical protein